MPPHHYRFYTDILYTKRQIYFEAVDIFYRQNLFVSLTCTHPEFIVGMADVVVVATGRHASTFKHHSMEVHLSSAWDSYERHQHFLQLIVAGDDIPAFCDILPGVCLGHTRFQKNHRWFWTSTSVLINVRCIVGTDDMESGLNDDSFFVKRLLEPFRRLYGTRVKIEGHVTPSYKKSVEDSAAQRSPTAAELVCMVSSVRKKGNDALQNGDLAIASTQYESALALLRSGFMRLCVLPATGEMPELPEKGAETMIRKLQMNLGSLLASVYLDLGEYAKSYRCAQDIRCSISSLIVFADEPIQLKLDCGHLMFCKALAGKALGQPVQALMDLDLALKFCPDDEAMKRENDLLCEMLGKVDG